MNSKFYDEESFKKFIDSTPFKEADFIEEGQLTFGSLENKIALIDFQKMLIAPLGH
ncbi:MAG: hypothetical protein ACFFBQ_01020 [Promethearchaeota archaeon]